MIGHGSADCYVDVVVVAADAAASAVASSAASVASSAVCASATVSARSGADEAHASKGGQVNDRAHQEPSAKVPSPRSPI